MNNYLKAGSDLEVDIDIAADCDRDIFIPQRDAIINWIEVTLANLAYSSPVQLSIRIVGEQEITQLNDKYRNKNQVTNVLSFPFQALPGVDIPLLGDVVICARIVQDEADQQCKSCEQHWAHMIVHGVLHLLGYDHIKETDAQQMESTEIEILSSLGFSNPYGELNTP